MEAKTKVPQEEKETLLNKAGKAFQNMKQRGKEKAKQMVSKARESEVAEKAKEKLGGLREGTKDIVGKVTDKFSRK
jgi:hypothetical protein